MANSLKIHIKFQTKTGIHRTSENPQDYEDLVKTALDICTIQGPL